MPHLLSCTLRWGDLACRPRRQVFAGEDPGYAARALGHARQLYAFADVHRGAFAASVPAMGAVYPSPVRPEDALGGGPFWT